MEREYYEDYGYKPFLFYVIFGITGDELEVSQSKHHVDGLPENMDIRTLTRAENGDYINGFFEGAVGEILKEQDEELFEACRAAENCVVFQGEVQEDSTLDYMRNVIGIIQAFAEKGAVGILDFLTFELYSPEDWHDIFFEQDINAQNHVKILYSEDEDGIWLHTRGMAEFGRPDIGIYNVPEDLVDDYEQLINQMIFYGGQGLFFESKVKLHTADGKTFVVNPEFVNDFENEDYNNAYYIVKDIEEIK